MPATETDTITPPLCEVLPSALFAKVPELYSFSPCVTEQQKCQDFVDPVFQLNGYYHNVLELRDTLQHTHSLTVPGRFGMADHEVPQEALTAYRAAGRETLLKLDAILVSMRPLVERLNDEKRLVERLHDSDGRLLSTGVEGEELGIDSGVGNSSEMVLRFTERYGSRTFRLEHSHKNSPIFFQRRIKLTTSLYFFNRDDETRIHPLGWCTNPVEQMPMEDSPCVVSASG